MDTQVCMIRDMHVNTYTYIYKYIHGKLMEEKQSSGNYFDIFIHRFLCVRRATTTGLTAKTTPCVVRAPRVLVSLQTRTLEDLSVTSRNLLSLNL